MASYSDIQAGRAYVRLFLKNDMSRQLVRALRTGQAKLRSFGQSAVGMGRSFAMAGAAASAPFVFATRTFIGFEDRMLTVKAVTGAVGNAFDKLSGKAKKLGRSTSFMASEVAGGMVELGRAGFKPAAIDASIASILSLARATGTELPKAAEIAAGTLRAFSLETDQMTHVSDVMVATANNSAQTLEQLGDSMAYVAPIAEEYRLTLEETSKALGVMANMQIKGSMAGTSMRMMLLQLSDPSIRKQLEDRNVDLSNFGDAMTGIGEAMAGMSGPERLAFGKQMFGQRAVGGALKLTRGGFDDLRNAIDNAAGSAAKASAVMDSGLGGTWRRMMSAIEGVQIAIGKALSPTLSMLAKQITSAAQSAIKWIEHNEDMIVVAAATAAGLITAGVALIGLGIAAHVASFAIGGFIPLVRVVGIMFNLLLLPVKMAAFLLRSVFSVALGIVKISVSAAASVISGSLTVAIWSLKTALSAARIGFHAMVSGVTIGINVITAMLAGFRTMIAVVTGGVNVMAVVTAGLHAVIAAAVTMINVITGLSSAIMWLTALGPVALVAGLAGAFLAAWYGANKLVQALTAASRGIQSGFNRTKQAIENVGKAAGDAAVDMGAKIRDGVVAGVDAARRALRKLVKDGTAGFRHLVADIGGSWQTLQKLIAAGDMAGAWKLTLSIVKLEWVRFKQWLVELWDGIKPTVNGAITNVADRLGNILASLKITWGDIWDGLQNGLKTFLRVLDKAMDSARKYIAKTEGFFGRDPVVAAAKAKRLRVEERSERARSVKYREGGDDRTADMYARFADDYARAARKQEAIVKQNKWLTGADPALELLVPGARSPEQKAGEDAAARELGKSVSRGIKDALATGEKTPAEKAAEAAANKEELASAIGAHAIALAAATKATAAALAVRKQKEQQEVEAVAKAAGGGAVVAGGKPATAVPTGVALTATYSAAAASISGYRPAGAGPEEKTAAETARIAENTKQMLIKMGQWLQQNETMQSLYEQFLAGWKVT